MKEQTKAKKVVKVKEVKNTTTKETPSQSKPTVELISPRPKVTESSMHL
jgi:hypothetical protein